MNGNLHAIGNAYSPFKSLVLLIAPVGKRVSENLSLARLLGGSIEAQLDRACFLNASKGIGVGNR
ncbi:hypothetical protein D3C85_1122940 [compost metagenome]